MVNIDASLVEKLIATQFPQWARLPISPVKIDGWDNRTFHLGEDLSVRLPSAECYRDQVAKEQLWLPKLAPCLPLPIPQPMAMGLPGEGYPWNWSVYRWLPGESANIGSVDNMTELATDLARFLTALNRADPADGPPPGPHNFYRGGSLQVYDGETREAIAALHGSLDNAAVTAVWEAALAAHWTGSPVWLHGDMSVGNLLVRDGRLSAVIDFGCSAVGDPACDLCIAWTLFSGESREVFRAGYSVDDGTWARGRGWTLWKALITIVEHQDTDPSKARLAREVLKEVLADCGDGDGEFS